VTVPIALTPESMAPTSMLQTQNRTSSKTPKVLNESHQVQYFFMPWNVRLTNFALMQQRLDQRDRMNKTKMTAQTAPIVQSQRACVRLFLVAKNTPALLRHPSETLALSELFYRTLISEQQRAESFKFLLDWGQNAGIPISVDCFTAMLWCRFEVNRDEAPESINGLFQSLQEHGVPFGLSTYTALIEMANQTTNPYFILSSWRNLLEKFPPNSNVLFKSLLALRDMERPEYIRQIWEECVKANILTNSSQTISDAKTYHVFVNKEWKLIKRDLSEGDEDAPTLSPSSTTLSSNNSQSVPLSAFHCGLVAYASSFKYQKMVDLLNSIPVPTLYTFSLVIPILLSVHLYKDFFNTWRSMVSKKIRLNTRASYEILDMMISDERFLPRIRSEAKRVREILERAYTERGSKFEAWYGFFLFQLSVPLSSHLLFFNSIPPPLLSSPFFFSPGENSIRSSVSFTNPLATRLSLLPQPLNFPINPTLSTLTIDIATRRRIRLVVFNLHPRNREIWAASNRNSTKELPAHSSKVLSARPLVLFLFYEDRNRSEVSKCYEILMPKQRTSTSSS
jgi:hypothetical protein